MEEKKNLAGLRLGAIYNIRWLRLKVEKNNF